MNDDELRRALAVVDADARRLLGKPLVECTDSDLEELARRLSAESAESAERRPPEPRGDE